MHARCVIFFRYLYNVCESLCVVCCFVFVLHFFRIQSNNDSPLIKELSTEHVVIQYLTRPPQFMRAWCHGLIPETHVCTYSSYTRAFTELLCKWCWNNFPFPKSSLVFIVGLCFWLYFSQTGAPQTCLMRMHLCYCNWSLNYSKKNFHIPLWCSCINV